MNQFEPSKAFIDDNMATQLHKVGEHPSHDSDEEL